MKRNHIWIIIGVIGTIILFLMFILLLKGFGFFDFTGTDASAKIVASTIALVSGLIGSLVTIIGIFIKNSIDQRNANLKEEAEGRLKLEAGLQAIKLLSTESGVDVPFTQRAGVLFTLTHLKQSDLAITLLNQMLPNDKIDANTASWLINHVLEFKKPGDLSIEATGLLNDYHNKFLVKNGYYEFPRCLNLKWNMKLPKLARRNAVLALLKITIYRLYSKWKFDALNAIIATLIFIWNNETDKEIHNGVGKCLKIIIELRADYTLNLPSGEIKVNKVRSELEKITHFPTSTEFVNISELLKVWVCCEEDCSKIKCKNKCKKLFGHTGKHKCDNGHEWQLKNK